MLHQIKAPRFYTYLGLHRQCLNPVNGKIQGLFNVLGVFQVLFNANLNFKDFSRQSTFQACANPAKLPINIWLKKANK